MQTIKRTRQLKRQLGEEWNKPKAKNAKNTKSPVRDYKKIAEIQEEINDIKEK